MQQLMNGISLELMNMDARLTSMIRPKSLVTFWSVFNTTWEFFQSPCASSDCLCSCSELLVSGYLFEMLVRNVDKNLVIKISDTDTATVKIRLKEFTGETITFVIVAKNRMLLSILSDICGFFLGEVWEICGVAAGQ